MDKRLQKALDAAKPIKDKKIKAIQDAATAKQKEAENLEKLYRKRAKEYVDVYLFEEIKHAEAEGGTKITIGEFVCGAPGKYAADLVKKINGLKVTPNHVPSERWDDCSPMTAPYTEYIISWK